MAEPTIPNDPGGLKSVVEKMRLNSNLEPIRLEVDGTGSDDNQFLYFDSNPDRKIKKILFRDPVSGAEISQNV